MELIRLVVTVCLLVANFISCTLTAIPGCPKQCLCSSVRPRTPVTAEQLKLRCGGEEPKVSSLTEIQFSSISQEVTQLDLSANNIERIAQNTFKGLGSIQKLDLSRNKIESIEKEAFKHLDHLKRLYLSSNKIVNVNKATFKGLRKVERLKLNLNLIVTIKEGAFDELISLKQLDVSDNPLMCSCEIMWILDWARNRSVKLSPPPKCATPAHLAGEPLRKLQLGAELQCTGRTPATAVLELRPARSQVVFAGDSLALSCRTQAGESRPLTWTWEDREAAEAFADVRVQEGPDGESWLHIERLADNHTGQWRCHREADAGNQTRDIAVIVISENTQYCPQEATSDSKGAYLWPRTVLGFPAQLPCAGDALGPKLASRPCSRDGRWNAVDASHCPFVSETTKILEQFAKMNLTLSKGTILESAKRLKNFTGDGRQLVDVMDVVFAAQTVENYARMAVGDKELGALLVDTVAAMMQAPRAALAAAQRQDRACSRLVDAVQSVADEGSASHGPSLAVEDFRVRRDAFPGLACTWYSHTGGRVMHCSNSNNTLDTNAKVMQASVQVPASLFAQLEAQGVPTLGLRRLTVTMLANGRLFPQLNETESSTPRLDVASAVVGVQLVGVSAGNLTEPVYVILRTTSSGRTTPPRPAWWDVHLNGGAGGWSPHGCTLSYLLDGLLVFQCNRLGYFALLQDASTDTTDSMRGIASRPSHPLVFLGAALAVVCLLTAAATFALYPDATCLSAKTRHSLANTWLALALLCLAFAVGIHQTEHVLICQGIGLLLHYLSLSALLWMAVTLTNLYKRLTKSALPPSDDLPSEELPVEKPLLGLYLVGWGIGLIVTGISGAVNVREYAGHTHCFLTAGPALSAVMVPAAMLVAYLTALYLLTRCAVANALANANGQLSEGTQATEHVDIELLSPGSDRGSVASVPTSSSQAEDSVFPPRTQLRTHAITLMLYLITLAAGAAAAAPPLRFAYDEVVFGAIFAVFSSALGGFVLAAHCLSRPAVRARWFATFKRRRRHRAQVADSAPAPPPLVAPPTTLPPMGGRASRASVKTASSVRTSASRSEHARRESPRPALSLASTNHGPTLSNHGQVSANHGQAMSIHGQSSSNHGQSSFKRGMGPANHGLASSHLGLVQPNHVPAWHRARLPHHSATSCTEASGTTSGAEMFYNPAQSTAARKFFRKQRRHMRRAAGAGLGPRRGGDGGGDSEGVADLGGVVGGVSPPMERLVLGAERDDEEPKGVEPEEVVVFEKEEPKLEEEAKSEGEAALAELAEEFRAIREEMGLETTQAEQLGSLLSLDAEETHVIGIADAEMPLVRFTRRPKSGAVDQSYRCSADSDDSFEADGKELVDRRSSYLSQASLERTRLESMDNCNENEHSVTNKKETSV